MLLTIEAISSLITVISEWILETNYEILLNMMHNMIRVMKCF